ncbi:heavy-metal-associated domain-containing protein [Aurantibacter crassamenti]|uniref:heavy-metal-associated domain-containing protein n=1 Tax=Aurantibacter crassamenti TaxID=1837375 RepID=UPI00193A7828|nr:heavy-metal-associated domain-containing protein [Aurantibacter crassamenti]MBM1106601.1 heavy-metal-associated domain-containing protein [Aurantibacter crassamenti]
MRTTIIVQNLKCGGCAKTITSKLVELNSISDVEVNFDFSSVSFHCIDVNDAILAKEKLQAIGYPSIDAKNTVVSKAKSYVSCATGKISK